jgi:hypothetical protein
MCNKTWRDPCKDHNSELSITPQLPFAPRYAPANRETTSHYLYLPTSNIRYCLL